LLFTTEKILLTTYSIIFRVNIINAIIFAQDEEFRVKQYFIEGETIMPLKDYILNLTCLLK